MAIRKSNSRASDRVHIRRMSAQGFSIEQIEAKLSITPQHIAYIIDPEGYDKDAAKQARGQKELDNIRKEEKAAQDQLTRRTVHLPVNAMPDLGERDRIRDEIRAELKAEAEAAAAEAPVDPEPLDTEGSADAAEETEGKAEAEESEEKKKKSKRRKVE